MLEVPREVAADLYGLLRGFEANYSHPFMLSFSALVEQLRDQLTYEEGERGNERYAVFAEAPE